VFNNIPEEKMFFERAKKGWLDDVENDLKKMGDRDWRKIVKNRVVWKFILKVRVVHGP
jgi:hypothetical protein